MLQSTSKDGSPEGADLFIPSAIYILLQLREDQCGTLHSNLRYIRLFRHEERLSGEDDYYLTTIEGAVTFMEDLPN